MMTTTTRLLGYGWILPHEPVIVVTPEKVEMVFSPVQEELDAMAADLEALRNGQRPIIYPQVPVKIYRRLRRWWKQ